MSIFILLITAFTCCNNTLTYITYFNRMQLEVMLEKTKSIIATTYTLIKKLAIPIDIIM